MNPTLVLVCVFVLAVGMSAQAGWKFDFEDGLPAELRLINAAITDEAQYVVSGGKSVIADFRTDGGTWNEFLESTPELVLKSGRLYRVSYHYKVIDPGEPEARFYTVFKSSMGGEIYGNFWLWNRERGATGRIDRLIRPDNDGYRLILGVRNKAAISVDDIVIEDVTDVPINPAVGVKVAKSRIPEIKAEMDRLRYAQGIPDMVRDFAVIMCDEGAGAKAVNAKRQIVADFNPDFVDWSPFGPLAKEYGIRSSRGGTEYQEYYKFEGPEVWENRYEKFFNSGFALSLDGTVIRDETWGEGGYFTCHNGRNWHDFFNEKIVEVAKKHLAICQDNISCAPWLKGYGCFCEACEVGFRKHLQGRYNTQELSAMGIENIAAFSAREYFVSHGRWGFRAVEDPVVREYIKFQHISQLEAWAAVVRKVKEVGRSQGNRAIPVYGNQIGASGMWPYAVAVSQLTDAVEIEEVISVRDRIQRQSMYYKLGRASGYEERPVWVRGPVYDDTRPKTPMLKTAFWAVHLAEALANGGFRVFSLGMNAPWTGEPDTLDFIDDPQLYSLYTTFAKFIDDNRALFTRRESMAQVALVYSLPSLIFRRYYPLDLDDNTAFERVQKTADLLDSSHIPFDALVFGHPEIYDDEKVLNRLSKYKVIVLPTLDAISDAQADALRKFVEGGGKLVVAEPEVGVRDENFNRRPSPALSGVEMIDLTGKREDAVEAMRAASLVEVEAPETVTVNLWRSCGGRSLDIHLLNYDVEVQANKANPASRVQVKIRAPQGFFFDKAIWTRPGIRRLQVGFERDGEWVKFTLPTLEDYSVISLTTESALNDANADAKERRLLDKEAVKKLAAQYDLY